MPDREPGIRRKGRAAYIDPAGRRVRDQATLHRIAALVIPPAWREVWICADPRGHIQATGRDARGRKQYRYHAQWREARDETKYSHMTDFARVLPGIRRRVARDLKKKGLPREKIVAALVRLLETTLIRVGNDEYARDNGSYGLTTIRNRHVRVRGGEIAFSFRGKSGKQHDIRVEDRKLARIVRRCQDLPGQRLFEYVADDGTIQEVGSHDVNDYLRAVGKGDYTAKDFRTWIGTVLAAIAFQKLETAASATQAKKNAVTVIASVATVLGNTPAVCRKCYIHPRVVDAYLSGRILRAARPGPGEEGLRSMEAAVLGLLARRAAPAPLRSRHVSL